MHMSTQAYQGLYYDESAIWLMAGQYEAAILPGRGGNLIAFRDVQRNFHFLREPSREQMDTLFRKRPFVFGIPVLFPPNRFDAGRFTYNGVTYNFPINEIEYGNHLHGFLFDATWMVDAFGADERESYAVISVTVDENHPIFAHFPHKFTVQLRYSLTSLGLSQHVLIRNDGDTPMPCMVAFHTTINAPFASDSSSDDYRFTMTMGDRWELNDRMLPTGKYQELTASEQQMKQGGISPFYQTMDNHYTAQSQNGSNRMELTDANHGVTLIYDAGTAYRQWMIWNNEATPGFFCPEPQTNLINAPNVNLSDEQKGFIVLPPKQIWEETSRLYTVEGKRE